MFASRLDRFEGGQNSLLTALQVREILFRPVFSCEKIYREI